MKIACYCRCVYNDGKSLHLQEEYMKSALQEAGVSEQDVVFTQNTAAASMRKGKNCAVSYVM